MANPEHQYTPHESQDQDAKAERVLSSFVASNFGIAIGRNFESMRVESRLRPPEAKVYRVEYPYTLSLRNDLTLPERMYHLVHAAAHCTIGDLLDPDTSSIDENDPVISRYSPRSAIRKDHESQKRHALALTITDKVVTGLSDDDVRTIEAAIKTRTTIDLWRQSTLTSLKALSTTLQDSTFEPYKDGVLAKIQEEKDALRR